MNTLWQQYQILKADHGKHFYPREAAAALGVSEGELMAAAPGSVYLGKSIRDIVLRLDELGEVECIVRNSLAVHEKCGVYENVSLTPTSGIALNIGALDLRIFTRQWHHAIAVTHHERTPVSRSIQFYDEYGTAIQKVFMRDESRLPAWQALLEAFAQDNTPVFEPAAATPAVVPVPLSDERKQAFQERWLELKDVHHFGGLLETFALDRIAAYEHAPQAYAVKVAAGTIETALEAVRESGMEVLVFVGNRGIVQIQTGAVHNIKRMYGFLNIMDQKEEGFSLHLQDDQIAETWIVRRPTRDGIVTCIEAFDAQRQTVFQLFGRRIEGETELEVWRAITGRLMQ